MWFMCFFFFFFQAEDGIRDSSVTGVQTCALPIYFRGALVFFNPAMFVPIVNHPQFGTDDMNARGVRWIFMLLGHLKEGVTPAQAAADLNAVGAQIQRTYPRDTGKLTFTLARTNLDGDYLGCTLKAF